MEQALRPLFVSVTWGAGGSTATKSLELAEVCQRQLGLTTCLHLTCTNMSRKLVDEALEEAKALGLSMEVAEAVGRLWEVVIREMGAESDFTSAIKPIEKAAGVVVGGSKT